MIWFVSSLPLRYAAGHLCGSSRCCGGGTVSAPSGGAGRGAGGGRGGRNHDDGGDGDDDDDDDVPSPPASMIPHDILFGFTRRLLYSLILSTKKSPFYRKT